MSLKSERIFSWVLLLVALFLLSLAWGYDAPIAYDPLGPKPYPVLILSLMAACCLFLAVRPIKATPDTDTLPLPVKKLALCVLFLLCYAILFEMLGFIITTALMAFGVGKLFGGKTKACVISAIVLGAGFYTLFDLLLDVTLPGGFLM